MSTPSTLARFSPWFRRPVLRGPQLSALLSLRRQREQLARLDTDALADIGVTRNAALAEARRPFWDAPEHWRG
ncbi:DUF1127 domain-containing protein [Marimonas arenosa]|uniref:DUF1127 domain-containing protein n=1 Tax=Marimonas arenosa TaxID=1795305 RepID=A0AAE3WCD3_9RHOB|nr:DUF1127 domain-containing protein [Marimonas arenosa]MDQ2090029.1 DUF1127 domain-containing protein [Marimonas arenosa]